MSYVIRTATHERAQLVMQAFQVGFYCDAFSARGD